MRKVLSGAASQRGALPFPNRRGRTDYQLHARKSSKQNKRFTVIFILIDGKHTLMRQSPKEVSNTGKNSRNGGAPLSVKEQTILKTD